MDVQSIYVIKYDSGGYLGIEEKMTENLREAKVFNVLGAYQWCRNNKDLVQNPKPESLRYLLWNEIQSFVNNTLSGGK